MFCVTIIRFGSVISRIIKVSVRVISLSLRLRLITPTSTLIIVDITKTSSNNCLLFYHAVLSRTPFNNFFRRKINTECKLDVLKCNIFPSENKATQKQPKNKSLDEIPAQGLFLEVYGSETTTTTTVTALTSKEQPVETCTS